MEVTRFAMIAKHYTQGMSIDSYVGKRFHDRCHFLQAFAVKISQVMYCCCKLSPVYLAGKVSKMSMSVKSASNQIVVDRIRYY